MFPEDLEQCLAPSDCWQGSKHFMWQYTQQLQIPEEPEVKVRDHHLIWSLAQPQSTASQINQSSWYLLKGKCTQELNETQYRGLKRKLAKKLVKGSVLAYRGLSLGWRCWHHISEHQIKPWLPGFRSSSLQCAREGGRWWWPKYLGPRHPRRRPGRSSWILALAWASPSYWNYLECEPMDTRSLSLPIWFSAFQIN